ncbi:MAG TPA: hypothetical protein VMB21_18455 [Candidatus Limnocylindria bacterium]|nr:hypothetical protein [Candidatus Limnocylindria bacterium]
MPNIVFDSLDQVPDEFKSIAKEVDGGNGKVAVNVVPKATVDEFRDKNIALSKERDGLVEKVTTYASIVGDDVESFAKNLEELRVTQQRVKDGELKEGRQIEEALGKRTEELRKEYDNRLQTVGKENAAWRDKYATLDQNFKRTLVASAIKDACVEADSGVEPRAIADIITSAYGTFRADDSGKVIPYDGEATIYGSDGVSPMTPKEWLARLKETKPFFFKPTQGAGSGGDTTKKLAGFDRKAFDKLTPAQKLEAANNEAARRAARG